MSRHQRLQKTMRNPSRQGRRAGKRPSSERERAYAAHRTSLESLFQLVPAWRPRKQKASQS